METGGSVVFQWSAPPGPWGTGSVPLRDAGLVVVMLLVMMPW